MTPSFGARLRSHRERRGIALDTIAQSTKIGIGILEGLERDDTSRWPSGIFRRGFLRAYATAVGLDPESTLKEFLERFPDPNHDVRVPFGEPPRLTLADERDLPIRREDRIEEMPRRSCDVPDEPPRLTLAEEPRRSVRSRVHSRRSPWPRVAAAACDVVVVIAIAAVAFAVVGMFWTPFTVTTVCYYFAGVLLVGTSPAGWVFGRRQQPTAVNASVAAPELQSRPRGDEADRVTPPFSVRRYPRAV